MSKKAAYFMLLALVIDQLPDSATNDYIIKTQTQTAAGRIASTLAGTTKDLPLLAQVVKTLLPGFAIPENIAAVLNQ